MLRVFVILLLLGIGSTQAASDRIWSALVLATKENPAGAMPRQLEDFAPAIEKVFGANTLYLLGEKKRDIVDGGEEWLVPSKEFYFKVECLSRDDTAYRLRIDLYRGKELLITTEARLARDAPLYIRGPAWGEGRLIFLLEVR